MKKFKNAFVVLLLLASILNLNGQRVKMSLNSLPPAPDYNPVNLKSTTAGWVELAVPCYKWSYGCAPTSVAMLTGYYDRHGFYCLYNGNVNGGAAPLFNDSWPEHRLWDPADPTRYYPNWDNSISATSNGLDGCTVDGNVNDFFVYPFVNTPFTPNDPDGWVANAPPHDFYNNGKPCAADYIGTSQDKFSMPDASTSYNYYPDGSPFDYTDPTVPAYNPNNERDISDGIKQFFEIGSGNTYYVLDCYNQLIDQVAGAVNGFTFEELKAEIDAQRPVIVHFTNPVEGGHTAIIFGYNATTNNIVVWDTWSEVRKEFVWGGSITDSRGNVFTQVAITVVRLDGEIVKSASSILTCKIGNITGPNDNVSIKNPPANLKFPPMSSDIAPPNTYEFYPGNNISFYALFSSYDCNTNAFTFKWKIELYHATGTYTYMTATTQGYENYPTACQTSSLWKTASSTSLPGYQWIRNENGTINGKVTVETTDNTGYINESAEYFIKVRYKPNKPVLKVFDSGEKSISFSFTSRGATSYKIYYGNSSQPPFSDAPGTQAFEGVSPITVGNNNVFSLTNLPVNTKIAVTGINENGESLYSNIIENVQYAKLPYTTSFEVTTSEKYWTFNSFTNGTIKSGGRPETPHSGYWFIIMTALSDAPVYATNYADLHMNLYNERNVMLDFYWKDFAEEYNSDVDGVWLSNDKGVTFHKVANLDGSGIIDNTWYKRTLNITTLAEQINLPLTKDFVIRFAQKGDDPLPNDGIALDDIYVYSNYTPTSPVTTQTFSENKDAFLYLNKKPGYEYIANTNYGAYPMIRSDEYTFSNYRTNSRSLLQFDLSSLPQNTVVKSARLMLYATNPQPTDDYKHISNLSTGISSYKSNACWLKRVVKSWDENTVTYNNQPATSDVDAKYLQISETYTQNYLNIDVTSMVDNMIKHPDKNFGFMLDLAKEEKYTRMAYASSDHTNSSLHPKLIIEYHLEEPTGSLKNTGNSESQISDDEKRLNIKGEIKIYPNPIMDELFVELPEREATLKIMDLNGRLMKQISIYESTYIVDCSDLSTGIYIIQFVLSDRVEKRMFEKIK